MAQVVTLSSVGTAAMILNPVAKSTTVILSGAVAASSGGVQIELTLDDPTIVGGPSITWGLLSSAAGMNSYALLNGLVYTVLSPIGGVRINSSALTATTWTLKALQSISA